MLLNRQSRVKHLVLNKGDCMIIDGEEHDSIVFYDKDTNEVCAIVSDADIVIPENCEVAIFREGTQPIFKDKSDTIILSGVLITEF